MGHGEVVQGDVLTSAERGSVGTLGNEFVFGAWSVLRA